MKTRLLGVHELVPGDLVLLKNISLVRSASGVDSIQYLENFLNSRLNSNDEVYFSVVLSVIKGKPTTILFSCKGKTSILILCDLVVSTI